MIRGNGTTSPFPLGGEAPFHPSPFLPLPLSRWRVSHNEWLGCKVTDRIPTAFIVIVVISRDIGRHTGTKVNRQGRKKLKTEREL